MLCKWAQLIHSLPVCLILWYGCWWSKQITSFILQEIINNPYTSLDVRLFFWDFQVLELSLLISTVCYWMWWCVLHSPLSSYLAASRLWCRESGEGKGQIRVVKGAGGRNLRGEYPISSAGRVLQQTQWLMLAHIEQNMVISSLSGVNWHTRLLWPVVGDFPPLGGT